MSTYNNIHEISSPSRTIEKQQKVVKNLCIGCGTDLGMNSAAQLCGKTFCYEVENNKDIGKEWQCRECKIELTICKCPLCDSYRDI